MTVQSSIAPSRRWSKVTVSDKALEALAALRTTEHAAPGQLIGLIPTASGIGFVLDTPGPSDRVISRDERPVLFISADLERRLRGCILDFVGPAGRGQFTVDRRQSRNSPGLDSRVDHQSSALVASPRKAGLEHPDHVAQAKTKGGVADVVEVYEDKRPDGFAFHLRVRATGRLYRCEPARDPNQPRYWCFRIFRCLPSRMVDVTERPWHGEGGMTWSEVPAAVEAIRADPNGWLETKQFQQLRRWILEEDQQPEDNPHSSL